jgi:hypothetical protein
MSKKEAIRAKGIYFIKKQLSNNIDNFNKQFQLGHN